MLLLLICAGLWYAIPWARSCVKEDMAQIQTANDKIHEANRAQFAEVIKTYDRHLDRLVTTFADDQTRDEEAAGRDRELILKLLSERPPEKKQLAEKP